MLPLAEGLRDLFILVLLGSGLPLIISCLAGFLIALLQTATQIQEQSLGFLVKFLSMALVLAVAGPFLAGECLAYLQRQIAVLMLVGVQ